MGQGLDTLTEKVMYGSQVTIAGRTLPIGMYNILMEHIRQFTLNDEKSLRKWRFDNASRS